jgi:hypothetical protein
MMAKLTLRVSLALGSSGTALTQTIRLVKVFVDARAKRIIAARSWKASKSYECIDSGLESPTRKPLDQRRLVTLNSLLGGADAMK